MLVLWANKTMRFLLLASLFFFMGKTVIFAQALEYKVKATILGKFIKHTDWPTTSGLNNPGSPFIICVVGKNPFGSMLDHVYSFNTIKKHEVKICYIEKDQPLKVCHAIFLASNARNRLEEVLEFSEKYSILTFSDTPGWGEKGICVNLFITVKETVHFKINESSLEKNNVEVDRLLVEYGRRIK